MALIFKSADGLLRSWVIPYDLTKQLANKPGPNRRDPWLWNCIEG